jgi:acyl carrier protein
MNDTHIRVTAREIVAEILELDGSDLSDGARFDDLGANSVQQMEIVAELSTRLGVEYSIREERLVQSVDDAVAISKARLA